MSNYSKIIKLYNKLHNLEHLKHIVEWDQQTMMPFNSIHARINALTEYAVLLNDYMKNSNLDSLIKDAKNEKLNSFQSKILMSIETDYTLKYSIDRDLIKAKSLATLKCEHDWRIQRKDNDWRSFSKNFKEVVRLSRKVAKFHLQDNCTPYDSFLRIYEPGITSRTLDFVFNNIKSWLPNLIDEIMLTEINGKNNVYLQSIKLQHQREIIQYFIKKLGFDFTKGRMDTSTHAMCMGVPEDVRLTIRNDEENFFKSFMVAMHETGHALYEQNLPKEYLQYPIGKARSMSIHESQSLLFENRICKNKPFLEYFSGILKSKFSVYDISSMDLYRYYNNISPKKIRVESDEVTYMMHIILRYEIERDLINEVIEVDDIPDIWSHKMMEYLKINIKDDYANGSMQDIHWSQGIFGYFPSYALGSIFSVQQYHSIKKNFSNLEMEIRDGDFNNLFNWLKEFIWNKGSIYSTEQIIMDATGEFLNLDNYKAYVENKFLLGRTK